MIWLILAVFVLGVIVGHIWGWRKGSEEAIRSLLPLFRQVEEERQSPFVEQRQAAREGRQ